MRRAAGFLGVFAIFAVSSVASADERRGGNPADDLVLEAEAGYGVGMLSAVRGHNPQVVNGFALHGAIGWAFPTSATHSVAVGGFFEGVFDGDRTTTQGTAFSTRLGAVISSIGETTHVRLGVGYARTVDLGDTFGGLGASFALGWHVPLTRAQSGWRSLLTFDINPSFDTLGANGDTLYRFQMALLVGGTLY
jgi:hypothetical protein